MQFYQNPNRPDHAANNAAFARIVKDFPELNLFRPDAERAPWHWQAAIDAGTLNFWPHKMSAQIEPQRTVHGQEAVRQLIQAALTAETFGEGV